VEGKEKRGETRGRTRQEHKHDDYAVHLPQDAFLHGGVDGYKAVALRRLGGEAGVMFPEGGVRPRLGALDGNFLGIGIGGHCQSGF